MNTHTAPAPVNLFALARTLGVKAAEFGFASQPRNHAQAAARLDAIRAEALGVAAHWMGELEAGRGFG